MLSSLLKIEKKRNQFIIKIKNSKKTQISYQKMSPFLKPNKDNAERNFDQQKPSKRSKRDRKSRAKPKGSFESTSDEFY